MNAAPNSPESEAGLLGCCLIDPDNAIPLAAAEIPPDAFFDSRHKIIAEEVWAMSADRIPVDVVSLGQRLRDAGRLDESGGWSYLSTLTNATPGAGMAKYYCQVVSEKHLLRAIIRSGHDMARAACEFQGGDAAEILDEAERTLMAASTARRQQELPTIRDLMRGAVDRIQKSFDNPGAPAGIPTGFADFDRTTGGLQDGELIILAARPSVGKTSLAMNIAENVALGPGLPVGIFSLEMSRDALATRLLCGNANLSGEAARLGSLTPMDFQRLTTSAAKLAKSKIHIDDTPGLSAMQIRARARQMVRKFGCRLFVIDYLGLIAAKTGREKNRQNEIAEISGAIKGLAKDLGCPILMLCQLNRGIERDAERKPRLSDLRESGAIEQDADVVLMLFRREEPFDEETMTMRSALKVGMVIAKNRNGSIGELDLEFSPATTRFSAPTKWHS